MEIKTSEQWQQIHSEVKVLDPDGWDRTNYDFSWYKQLISEQEYLRRRDNSTCIGNLNNKNK